MCRVRKSPRTNRQAVARSHSVPPGPPKSLNLTQLNSAAKKKLSRSETVTLDPGTMMKLPGFRVRAPSMGMCPNHALHWEIQVDFVGNLTGGYKL